MNRSVSFAPRAEFDQTLEQAFPSVKADLAPAGHRILVQLRTATDALKSGIVLAQETKDAMSWNTQIGKLIALGPVAFKNRETLQPWPEGNWAEPGDYVRVPKYGGDRFEVPVPGRPNEVALFVVMDDGNIVGTVKDPMAVVAFV